MGKLNHDHKFVMRNLLVISILAICTSACDSSMGVASRDSKSPNQTGSNSNNFPGVTQEDINNDSTPPTATLLAPTDGDVLAGMALLQVTATDDIGVSSVQFSWDGRPIGSPINQEPFSMEWNSAEIPDGFYTIIATVTDLAGNSSQSNLAVVQINNNGTTVVPGDNPPPPPAMGENAPPLPPVNKVINVPGDFNSIQAAINGAANGDTIIVAPGTYSGGLTITGKSITLASKFLMTGNVNDMMTTIINGGSPIISVNTNNNTIVGFHFQDGSKGVQCFAYCDVRNNFFNDVGSDAMSLERAGGNIINNRFVSSGDDAIDCDGPENTLILGNDITGSKDDGIEIRNYNYSGPVFHVILKENRIDDSGEDGFQLIDYDENANRVYTVERNVITRSVDAGIGLMDNGDTTEDFRAASMPERIYVFNNTIDGNKIGLSGGDNLVAVNNIFMNSSTAGIKGVNGASTATYNLFFNVGTVMIDSNLVQATTTTGNPLVNGNYMLQPGSPAIDAGTATFTFGGANVLNIMEFNGQRPDLGALEF